MKRIIAIALVVMLGLGIVGIQKPVKAEAASSKMTRIEFVKEVVKQADMEYQRMWMRHYVDNAMARYKGLSEEDAEYYAAAVNAKIITENQWKDVTKKIDNRTAWTILAKADEYINGVEITDEEASKHIGDVKNISKSSLKKSKKIWLVKAYLLGYIENPSAKLKSKGKRSVLMKAVSKVVLRKDNKPVIVLNSDPKKYSGDLMQIMKKVGALPVDKRGDDYKPTGSELEHLAINSSGDYDKANMCGLCYCYTSPSTAWLMYKWFVKAGIGIDREELRKTFSYHSNSMAKTYELTLGQYLELADRTTDDLEESAYLAAYRAAMLTMRKNRTDDYIWCAAGIVLCDYLDSPKQNMPVYLMLANATNNEVTEVFRHGDGGATGKFSMIIDGKVYDNCEYVRVEGVWEPEQDMGSKQYKETWSNKSQKPYMNIVERRYTYLFKLPAKYSDGMLYFVEAQYDGDWDKLSADDKLSHVKLYTDALDNRTYYWAEEPECFRNGDNPFYDWGITPQDATYRSLSKEEYYAKYIY